MAFVVLTTECKISFRAQSVKMATLKDVTHPLTERPFFFKVTSMTKPMMKPRRCAHCRRRFNPATTGRPPKFCGPACRQAAYLARKTRPAHPVTLLAADLAHVHVREWLRREIWSLLRQAGLVSTPNPPAMPRPRSPKPELRLVEPEEPDE
jgi:hypothetical protein